VKFHDVQAEFAALATEQYLAPVREPLQPRRLQVDRVRHAMRLRTDLLNAPQKVNQHFF
jgi:hypothetical protein